MTLDNDINLAALGEQWRGIARGVDDFVVPLGRHRPRRRASCCAASSTAAATAPPARSTSCRVGFGEDFDPCASAVSALAARLAAGAATTLAPPYDARAIFGAARTGDAVARQVVAEEARRIALHVAPIAAVTDVALVVIGGGIGANGDLLLDPIRALLASWLPYPPQGRGLDASARRPC